MRRYRSWQSVWIAKWTMMIVSRNQPSPPLPHARAPDLQLDFDPVLSVA